MIYDNIEHLIGRINRNEESIPTILFRPIFWPNKYIKERVKVVEKEWDYLIVLDACRYDVFKKINNIPGNLKKKYSAGTHTVEWAKENFTHKLEDIVYISGNPQISSLKLKKWTGMENPFFHLERVWDSHWDEDINTVHPQSMNEATLRLKNRFPSKRFIIHYMQPHHPFIGEDNLKLNSYQNKILNSPFWKDIIMDSDISLGDIKEAFEMNLRIVLSYVKSLVDNLKGKKIITADHGEGYGEFGIFGHIPGVYTKPLSEIPWFEVKK